MTEREIDADEAAMWLQLADLIEAAKPDDKQGNVFLDQDEVAAKLGMDTATLIQGLNEFRPDFAVLFFRGKDIQFNRNFLWMLRAQVDPQPEDLQLTETEAKKRVARAGAEFMDAGQQFNNQTLARVTGVPHFHVGRIIREFEFEIDSELQLFGNGLYTWHIDDADKWRTVGYPLAEAPDEPLLVFNIERMETTLVQGDQYQQINNFTYQQVIESFTNMIEDSENIAPEEKQGILDRWRSFVEKAGPFLDFGVRIADVLQKAGGGG